MVKEVPTGRVTMVEEEIRKEMEKLLALWKDKPLSFCSNTVPYLCTGYVI